MDKSVHIFEKWLRFHHFNSSEHLEFCFRKGVVQIINITQQLCDCSNSKKEKLKKSPIKNCQNSTKCFNSNSHKTVCCVFSYKMVPELPREAEMLIVGICVQHCAVLKVVSSMSFH